MIVDFMRPNIRLEADLRIGSTKLARLDSKPPEPTAHRTDATRCGEECYFPHHL
jgi:hypothetical protein